MKSKPPLLRQPCCWLVLGALTLIALVALIVPLAVRYSDAYTHSEPESLFTVKHTQPPPPTTTTTENYPVEFVIPLPTGEAANIPKIQHDFPSSSSSDEDRDEDSSQTAGDARSQDRLDAIKAEFHKAWEGYRQYAWLHDELKPVSRGFGDPYCGWAATLVDSLDTLWIMGFQTEFDDAVDAVAQHIDFSQTGNGEDVKVFETTIRYMGGLLSAYDLATNPTTNSSFSSSSSKYGVLLEKARQLGDTLLWAFDTPNRMPVLYWRPEYTAQRMRASRESNLAELGSLTMEFTRLAQLTGDNRYYDAVARITNALTEWSDEGTIVFPGMFPDHIDASGCNVTTANEGEGEGNPECGGDNDRGVVEQGLTPTPDKPNVFPLGGNADSVYEYFAKVYLLLGGRGAEQYSKFYAKASDTIQSEILFRVMTPDQERDLRFPKHITVHPEDDGHQEVGYEVAHLTCFIGGMFALGGKVFARQDNGDLDTAARLTDACVWAYETMPSGIMPELATAVPCPADEENVEDGCAWNETYWEEWVVQQHADDDKSPYRQDPYGNGLPYGYAGIGDDHYSLRPEAIESVWYMYRITGDTYWQERGWAMWEAIAEHTATDVGASALEHVNQARPDKTDAMESFWTAETLKYFYLLFSPPDVISLDEWVLNTEAHPFRRGT